MNRICLVLLCAAVLFSLAAAGAHAQYNLHERSKIGVKAVIFRPDATELTDLKDNWLGPEISYHFGFDNYDRPNQTISIGWFGEDSARATGKLVPLTASYIYRLGEDEENPWFVEAGIGAYFASYEYIHNFSIVKDRETLIGYRVSFGREIGSWFGALEYHIVDDLQLRTGNSIDFSGWAIVLGSRYTF